MKFAATVPTNSAGCKKLPPINAVPWNLDRQPGGKGRWIRSAGGDI